MIRILLTLISHRLCISCWGSIYWDYALTVPLRQIVCIHCHQRREFKATFPQCTLAFLSQKLLQIKDTHFFWQKKDGKNGLFIRGFFFFQLTAVVRWFWSARMGYSGRPSTSLLGVTSWPSSPAWKRAFYPGVSWNLPSGPRKERCVYSDISPW